MILNSVLDKEMMPVYETMTGSGKLKTSRLTIQDVNTLNNLSEVLKYDKIKRMVIDKIQLDFQFIDGKLLIEPFDMKVNNYKATLGGWTGFDQRIDYALNLQIPRSEFGGAANDFLEGLVKQANDKGAKFSLGEMVSLDAVIGGTLTNPTIKTNLKETGKSMADDVKKQIEDEIEKKKEELRKEAQAEADKILSDANKQADNLVAEANKQAAKIRKEAKSAATKITDEAEKQAKKVEEEGKKKGFLAEAAAKETAKQMRKEAQKQADNVIKEGNKQAEGIENKAKAEATKIKAEARKNADKVLEGI
jgi:cell division septum initiation protein DivIVA